MGHAEIGGRLVGGGRGGDRPAVRRLIGLLGGLVVVEGERRGGVRVGHRALGGGEPAREGGDPGGDGVSGRAGLGDPLVAGRRAGGAGGQPDGHQGGDRRPHEPPRERANTGVHVAGIDAGAASIEGASPHGVRRHARVTAEASAQAGR
jgi:hypothetical protein